MSWYIKEKLFSQADSMERDATLEDMSKFLTLWNCVCGTCIVCIACLEVTKKIYEEEE